MRGLTGVCVSRLTEAIDELERRRSAPRRELWRAALAVEHLVLADLLAPEEEREVFEELVASGRAEVCRRLFTALETTIESDFAALALSKAGDLASDRDGLVANYLVRYEELARREALLGRLSVEDHVLFVGSGPFPVSAIEYTRRTGCAVDCVDFVPEAIETSSAVVARLGLTGRMRCILARGEEVPMSAYSVVMVGVLANPKAGIFANIAATGAAGVRILARTTVGLRQLIYPAVPKELIVPAANRRVETSVARGDQVISTVALLVGSGFDGGHRKA